MICFYEGGRDGKSWVLMLGYAAFMPLYSWGYPLGSKRWDTNGEIYTYVNIGTILIVTKSAASTLLI